MASTDKIDLKPKKCNLCGGDVIYTSNAVLYGREYGSGRCYLCTECGAYVGTHKPRPEEALGILADYEMREKKKECHRLFDRMWKNAKERKSLYGKLAESMGIMPENCHFGYMGIKELNKAIEIMKGWNDG